MPADFNSPLLGLLMQGTGNNDNSWGDNLNQFVFAYLEQAIAGFAQIGVDGGTDSLSASQHRNAMLEFTGALAADQTIVVDNTYKMWLVNNATSGNFILQFKTAVGAAVEIRQGGWSLVWCDGNDVIHVGISTAEFASQIRAPSGTKALPGLAFAADKDTGARLAGYASGTLTNPFTTTNGSTTVTVAHNAHGLSVGDLVAYSSGAAVAGLDLNNRYKVASVPNANTYTITAAAQANAAATGGVSVNYKYVISAASANAIVLGVNAADVLHLSPFGALLTGALWVSSTLDARGAAYLASTLNVVGAVTLLSTLDVTGAATFAGTASIAGVLSLLSTSHFVLPIGTTVQRPGSPSAGMKRFNSTIGQEETFNGTIWESPVTAAPVTGVFKKLEIKVIGNRAATITADMVVTTNSAGKCKTTSVNSTLDMSSSGVVDALDTGGIAQATWYYLWAIAKEDGTTKVVASLQSTANATFLANLAAISSGDYKYYARIGALRTASGNANLLGSWQFGRTAQYIIGLAQTTAAALLMDSGTKGDTNTPTWIGVSTNGHIPPTASRIYGTIRNFNGSAMCAPNNSYTGMNTSADGPPASNSSTISWGIPFDFLLESSNIYWASNGVNAQLRVMGWEDNL